MNISENVVRVCGSSWGECGYCRGTRAHIVNREEDESSKVYNVLATSLTPEAYERLVQLSWRRSGTNLYRPVNDVSCCPSISIRLSVTEFKPTRSQRKVRRRMDTLLNPSTPANTSTGNTKEQSFQNGESDYKSSFILDTLASVITEILLDLTKHVEIPKEIMFTPSDVPFRLQPRRKNQSQINVVTTICARLAGKSKGALDRAKLGQDLAEAMNKRIRTEDSENGFPPPKKQLRPTMCLSSCCIEQVECHSESGQVIVQIRDPNKELTTIRGKSSEKKRKPGNVSENRLLKFFAENYPNVNLGPPPYRLVSKTLSARQSALLPEVHRLYFEYQHQIHGETDPFTELGSIVDTEWGNDGNDDSFRARAKQMLQDNYGHLPVSRQEAIVTSFGTFYDFLVDSPFPESLHYGTFHQHYRIGGVLVAVGVIDILPNGVSSVYLFYSPKFSQDLVPLGKLASLLEIEYTASRNLQYYYLGYYIESCGKMRYKAEYQPSELLCPVTFHWVDAAIAQERLVAASPVHHYGQLWREDANTMNDGDNHNNRNAQADDGDGSTAFRDAMRAVRMDVGSGAASFLTLPMLPEGGQDIVTPLLYEFVLFASPEIARDFVVDFR